MSGPITSQELACIYSAAILADDDIPITSDKICTLLKAAEVSVEPIWPSLYAKALQGIEIKQLITQIGNVSAGAGNTGAPPREGTESMEDADQEKATPVAAEVESEDDDDDMGLSLFD